MYLNPKDRSVSFQMRLKMFSFHHFQVLTRYHFQNVPIRLPFSKSTVFKICRQKMCRFRVNRRPIRRIFHRFQNVPASCERSLRKATAHKNTVKPRKQEHSKVKTCRLILWKKTPKDKNQKQTDLLQCSYVMVNLVDKFHHISVNKLPTIDN